MSARRRRRSRAWIDMMSRDDVARSWQMAHERGLDEIVAMARERYRKDQLIALWFMISCLAPLLVGLILIVQPTESVIANPWPWALAGAASLLLPLPAMKVGQDAQKEGRIIALAFWLKKDPRFLDRRQ